MFDMLDMLDMRDMGGCRDFGLMPPMWLWLVLVRPALTGAPPPPPPPPWGSLTAGTWPRSLPNDSAVLRSWLFSPTC
jgi:hypothetical protein